MHSLDYHDALKFRLLDQHGTPIHGKDLAGIVRQYYKSACFFIEIVLIDGAVSEKDFAEVKILFELTLKLFIITLNLRSQSLQNYMKNTNNEFIISEHERLRYLSKSTRKLLMNVLMAFIRDEFHNQPTKAEISSLCHATIKIFPILKSDNGVRGGIVRKFNRFSFSFIYIECKISNLYVVGYTIRIKRVVFCTTNSANLDRGK